jgi:hypothetical protein
MFTPQTWMLSAADGHILGMGNGYEALQKFFGCVVESKIRVAQLLIYGEMDINENIALKGSIGYGNIKNM